MVTGAVRRTTSNVAASVAVHTAAGRLMEGTGASAFLFRQMALGIKYHSIIQLTSGEVLGELFHSAKDQAFRLEDLEKDALGESTKNSALPTSTRRFRK